MLHEQLVLFDLNDTTLDEKETNISDSSKKVCRICKTEKDLDNFYLDRGAVYSRCKDCIYEYRKLLTVAKENAPEKPLDNKCECCGKITQKWYCDHHPNTDKFRGWVCFECNTAAGYVGDHHNGAAKLFNYLYNRRIII